MTLLIVFKINISIIYFLENIDYTYIINPTATFINRNMEVF
jgi:hypothetical protein